ncbi:RagB/SusD domain-containing protein [Chryseobacterium arachidis]|uniref:RagB/SusD domain-containing protein n=1 Tax=Chryseobacterium arachidis TaxID=1416778 RepID=A0A1M5ICQ5_9FLAO|nr:RagB/SusD family nutrient uptake outer membrane protein [Chryseobacterium arachidis]SHG26052.1 RagB/SusD domain-containing protein [Chryseobacterium arachidis]
MKTYKIIYILSLLLFVSCEKLLEVDVPENQIPNEAVFETVQTANAALSELYAGLWNSSPIAGDQSGTLLGSYTDDLTFYGTNSNSGLAEINLNQQTESNTTISTYWASAYRLIYLSNAIMEGTEKSVSISSADKERIIGEALLARSILFFYLQQLFGDIPIPTSTDYQLNQSLSRTPSATVLAQLKDDLAMSVTMLPDTYRSSERVIPNRKVAQLMLAKIYMLQSQWSQAENLLKLIVQNPMYQFENDITKVFLKSGNHIIWQLKPKNSGDPTKEVNIYYFINAAPSNYALSQNLTNVFTVNDKRKAQWTTAVTVGTNTWYRADKYKNRTNNANEYSIVFRLEEAYLLLAEVLTQQDKIVEALSYINATRQRAQLTALTMPISKQSLLNEILLENRKEFFTEMGHRFLDLKRLGRLNDLLITKPNWQNFHMLWPLPQKELLLNQNLNPQNSGY